ncbi:MAG: glycosyltransferase [Shimia sp.]
MRIAVLAHLRHPIAPPFAGGMEAHAWHLCAGLRARGHDVTLFAAGDSRPPEGVALHPVLARHYDEAFPWRDFVGTEALNAHVDGAMAAAMGTLLRGDFDVVHNNTLHRYPPRLAVSRRLPMVTSLHVPPFPALQRAVAGAVAPGSRMTVTSARQRDVWWPGGAPEAVHVAWNGIDPALWPPMPGGGDGGIVWAGRIMENKGAHLAVQAAAMTGRPLTLHGAVEDRVYFDRAIAPHLGGAVRYGGHLSGAALAMAYRRATVFLFTPLWEEPFGLAAVEAMATGLPVAATDRGAVREVVGAAGALAEDESAEALARAIEEAARIDPQVPIDRVRAHFTREAMLDRYEAIYAQAIAGAGQGVAPCFAPHELAVA